MWVLQVLVKHWDVTLFTRSGFDLEELNRLAGTNIASSQIKIEVSADSGFGFIGSIGAGLYRRRLYRVGENYGLRVSLAEPLPWGRPAVHFVSSVLWAVGTPVVGLTSSPKLLQFRRFLSRLVVAVTSGHRTFSKATDVFLVNSWWTKGKCQTVGILDARVIYPPVPGTECKKSYSERPGDVLVFGRISPEKCIEDCIAIVERARAAGFEGRLFIVGPASEKDYYEKIDNIAKARMEWVKLNPPVSNNAKEKLFTRFRYGLSACRFEAFGISTAEMIAHGIIVLVPKDNGQEEIVNDSRLIYDSIDTAATQLASLEANNALREAVLESASLNIERFSSFRFLSDCARELRICVENSTGSEE